MAIFTPVNYRNKPYPNGIICPIQEIAGHLDKTSISPSGSYSLHTEYAYGKRELSSHLLDKYPTLRKRSKKGIPQLWYDEQWAKEFAWFVIELVADNDPPTVIEIHPPFDEYCATIPEFLERYRCFEHIILERFPKVVICLENRAGTRYQGGEFLISSIESIHDFLRMMSVETLNLKLVLDYPQIFTAEHYKLENFPMEKFLHSHAILDGFQSYIKGIHIWGKRKSQAGNWTAHYGNLNSLFAENQNHKTEFLQLITNFYDDGTTRFFVPEVNSSPNDLQSIVNDFIEVGSHFVGLK